MLARFLAPLALLLSLAAPAEAQHARQRHPVATRTAHAAPGMVSTADPRATAAGVEILRQGGSATDAAAAVMIALTVVEPQSSGIGGGGFMVLDDPRRGGITTYNGRERAPMSATPAYFLGPDGRPLDYRGAIPGGLSVGVPGNLRLIEQAHRAHGRLPWRALFQPAIRLARDGFAITPRLYAGLQPADSNARFSEWGRQQFYQADGTPKPVGTLLRNPELAQVLEEIAARGPNSFYTGPLAQTIVNTVRSAPRNPGRLTTGDLTSYEAEERPAVCGIYRRYRVCGMGPPSSGGTTVFAILKQLERFDLHALGPNNPEAWHLIGESMRLAYADREAYVGDPDFVQVPVRGLVDPTYLAGRSRYISDRIAMPSVAPGTPPGAQPRTRAEPPPIPQTTHFTIADRQGSVVSYTSTVEGPFGSGLTVRGFFLNNELTDFSFAPEAEGAPVANRVESGKRPMSAMSPTIVYGPDGRVRLVVGAAGGPTIIAQVAKAIIGVIDWRMSAQEAIALPFLMGRGNTLSIERGTFLEGMAPALTAMGHQVSVIGPTFKANAIEWVGGRWVGAADPRSEGVAAGE
jgi:gamma-glutamyltranspeptidase / glutathione hydrolase